MTEDRRWTDENVGRRSTDVLSYRIDSLERTVGDIRDSIKSIDTSLATLTRVEAQHGAIMDTMAAMQRRLEKQGDAIDVLASSDAATVERVGTHHKLIFAAVLSAIGALVTALYGAIL